MLSNKQIKRNLFILLMAVAIALFGLSAAAAAQEVNDVNTADEPQMLGIVEGTGTYFEVTDSDYLNITLESSEPIVLRIESIPQMIIMDINLAGLEASTQLTLGGLEPSTTYYKYEDNYHNLAEFTTDDNGSYTYKQDLTKRHLVFIQSRPSTIFIPSDTNVGTWDPNTRIYTLTTDVYETIEIDQNDLTLDGDGHMVSGGGTGYGIYLNNRTGVIIKNVNVRSFSFGIRLDYSSNNNIVDNAVSNSYYGIDFYYSNDNALIGNTASANNKVGISLRFSHHNTLISNAVSRNSFAGIWLQTSNDNTLTGNSASLETDFGIYLYSSSDNILTVNNTSENRVGIYLRSSSNNSLSGNTMLANYYNFHILGSEDSHFGHEIDTTNTVDGKPIYYVKDVANRIYDSSTNAGTFYAINCNEISIKDLTITNCYHGLFLWKTQNSKIENVFALDGYYGIYLRNSNHNILTANTTSNNWSNGIWLISSSNNTLTGNTANSNHGSGVNLSSSTGNIMISNIANSNHESGFVLSYPSSDNILTGNTANSNRLYGILERSHNNVLTDNTVLNSSCGIYLDRSDSSILTGNTLSNNYYGVDIYRSNSNQIYNNNFIENEEQIRFFIGSGNVFNLAKPIGGNYWSNWCPPAHPDGDSDGFVDEPYYFTNGMDYLPLAALYVSNQPPAVDAGDNIQIPSSAQAYTVVQGTATDQDGDPLQYRWLEGAEVLLDWSPVGDNNEAYLDLSTLPYFSVGTHTLRLDVNDSQLISSDEMILTVDNSPPEAQPAPNYQVIEIGIDPVIVVADVADFDGDTVSYQWLKDSEPLASGTVETMQGGDAVPISDLNVSAGDPRFPVGVHQIELQVSDGVNNPVSVFVSLEVTDTNAPSLSPVPSITILWPPNHKLVPVTIQANASDKGGGTIHLDVEVQSSEPPDSDGDGHTIPDFYIDSVDDETGLIELRLRSERSGKGDGRTYIITITAIDASENQSVAVVEILAPHDRRKK